MAKIKRKANALTPERAHELFSYSRATGLVRRRIARGSRQAGEVVGSASASNPYLRVKVDGVTYQLHIVIWLMETGVYPTNDLDHRDGVKTNNRWLNLRLATRQQNTHNSVPQKNNKCGLKWVRTHRKGRFQATVGGVYLGTFKTPERAHQVGAAYAKKLHGRFFNAGPRARGAGQGVRV